MKTKTFLLITLLWLSTLSVANEATFKKGQIFITPLFAYNSYASGLGASLEIALSDNIGIGGTLMYASWSTRVLDSNISEKLVTPSAEAYYHFSDTPSEKLDIFAGISIGYAIYSWSWSYSGIDWSDVGDSTFYLSPLFGGKFYFTSKIAISVKARYSAIGHWAGFGGEAGITFKFGK